MKGDGWLTSPCTGVVTSLARIEPRPYDPEVSVWGGLAATAAGLLPVGGAGWTDEAARLACLGEAVERLSSRALPVDRLLEASWPLDEPAIDPRAWALFSREQYEQPSFPFRPFAPGTSCPWVACRRYPGGELVWVPEPFVFLLPRANLRETPPQPLPREGLGSESEAEVGDGRLKHAHTIAPGLSTGFAAGRAGDRVLLRGLQEVIERDALMGAWWGAYPLEELDRREVLERLGDHARRVSRPNLTYRFFRVRSPLSDHVTLATLEGEDREGPCFSVGSACRERLADSLSKALLEAVQGRHYVRRLLRETPPQPLPREGLGSESEAEVDDGRLKLRDGFGTPIPRSFADHAVYYSKNPGELARTPFARARGGDLGDGGEEPLDALVERLGPGRPVLWRLVTSPPVVRHAPGWCVVRVVVPGLAPLHGDHGLAHLGSPLWGDRPLADWVAWPPHPFP
jgi:ribosomal protein S12 methylthiotransferase accessory factor